MERVEQQMDNKNFLLELCRYYMEFLETDFRQKRAPKRRTDLKNGNSLLACVPLSTYAGLNQGAIKLLGSLLEQNKFAKVAPGQFSIGFEDETIQDIASKIEGKITKANIDDVRTAILKVASKAIAKMNIPDKERAIEDLNDLVEAKQIFSSTTTKQKITSFFKDYVVADFYRDIYELWKNKSILDKQDFYLYFFTISAEEASYPLFYLPLSVQQTAEGEFLVEPDAKLLVHRKAIEYIAQKTKDDNQKLDLPPRHIYINEEKDGLVGLMVKILNEVSDFFSIERVAFDGKNVEVLQGSKVSLSNNCYIAISDKSDEALLNDYEELIDLALKGGEGIFDIFKKLSEEFILEEPISANLEVTDEYEQMPLGGKLTYQSPIPLNQEQIQILSALDKEHVKRVIVEGPPGTGKSHTIAAIIYNALLKGKNVLVVSDKKEALDVVEDKISQVLEKTRISDDFVQNPILRLENRNNNFNKIFKPLNFEKIKDRYIAGRRTADRLNSEVASVTSQIVSATALEVDTLASVDFEKIKYVVSVESRIKEEWDSFVDFQELESIDGKEVIARVFEIIGAYSSEAGRVEKYPDVFAGRNVSSEQIRSIEACLLALREVEEHAKGLSSSEIEAVKGLAGEQAPPVIPEEKLLPVENAYRSIRDAFEQHGESLRKLTKDGIQIPVNSCEYQNFAEAFSKNAGIAEKVIACWDKTFAKNGPLLGRDITPNKLVDLKKFIESVEALKKPIIGHLFQGGSLKKLDDNFKRAFPLCSLDEPHKHLTDLKSELLCYEFILECSMGTQEDKYFKTVVLSELQNIAVDEAYRSFGILAEKFNGLTFAYASKLSTLEEEAGYQLAIKTLGAGFKDFQQVLRVSSYLHFVSLVSKVESVRRNVLCETATFSIDQHLDIGRLHALRERLEEVLGLFNALLELEPKRSEMRKIASSIPSTLNKLGVNIDSIQSLSRNRLVSKEKEEVDGLVNYLKYKEDVTDKFSRLGPSTFRAARESLENRLVAKMTSILDEKVVQYANSHQNTYRQLAKIIREKRKIPKEDLGDLVRAFPCLIIGIRDLGDYLPLEAGVFDVVIIDEASQVSIAQAFPAIIRGKKVVVFGDEKQFSNVKTSTADKEINNASFNKVKEAYFDAIKALSPGKIEKVKGVSERFNIRSSILDFLKNLANYHCSLKKHFRGYQELMAYSNSTFYNGSLQIMKLRARPITEVIKFDVIQADPRQEAHKNTNQDEANFILTKLNELKESGKKVSVGIITPFSNQQKLISNMVFESVNAEYFKQVFNIKVMTFDTAQGEERDIIYYSMVEKPDESILRYIFPVSLNNLEDEEEGSLKSQRLNVGLSRAKETVHFVLSKNLEDIKGEMGNALRYFNRQLQESKKMPRLDDTESEMEKLLLHYIQQTPFYQENSADIEIIPQFEIGKYLKQISKADIPDYRVDFLMIYRGEKKEKVIVIEYDGFEFHFKSDEIQVNEFNYDKYYVEQDVERQRILESYGYSFLRFNKFILRDKPVEEIDKRLSQLLKKKL